MAYSSAAANPDVRILRGAAGEKTDRYTSNTRLGVQWLNHHMGARLVGGPYGSAEAEKPIGEINEWIAWIRGDGLTVEWL